MLNEKSLSNITLVRLAPKEFGRFHPRNKVVPFELKYIEAVLRREGAQIELLDQISTGFSDETLIERIKMADPSLVVVSFTALSIKQIARLTKVLRQQKRILVGIGPGVGDYSPSYVKRLKESFDILIPGEAELELTRILPELSLGVDLKRLQSEIWEAFNRQGHYLVDDPDILPDLVYTKSELDQYGYLYPLRTNKKVVWGHVLASRGCPHGCMFCSPFSRKSYGSRIRYRKIERVIDEIKGLIAAGANVISFEDDDLMHSSRYVEDLCRQMISLNLNVQWVAHARVERIDTGLIGLMKQSGCILLRIGVETGNDRIIDVMNKGDGKNWQKTSLALFESLRRVGIATDALFIIGNPGEDENSVKETLAFAKDLDPDFIQVGFFEPYPGSAYFAGLSVEEREKIINSGIYHYQGSFFNKSRISDDRLKNLYKRFYKEFAFRIGYIVKHLCIYSPYYLFNPKIFKILSVGLITINNRNS